MKYGDYPLGTWFVEEDTKSSHVMVEKGYWFTDRMVEHNPWSGMQDQTPDPMYTIVLFPVELL